MSDEELGNEFVNLLVMKWFPDYTNEETDVSYRDWISDSPVYDDLRDEAHMLARGQHMLNDPDPQNRRLAFARQIVYDYVKEHLYKTDSIHSTFALNEVYTVWFCKVLQNWKALVSTTLPDDIYYEVTYDGDKKLIYLDAYAKQENIASAVPDGLFD